LCYIIDGDVRASDYRIGKCVDNFNREMFTYLIKLNPRNIEIPEGYRLATDAELDCLPCNDVQACDVGNSDGEFSCSMYSKGDSVADFHRAANVYVVRDAKKKTAAKKQATEKPIKPAIKPQQIIIMHAADRATHLNILTDGTVVLKYDAASIKIRGDDFAAICAAHRDYIACKP
jgi:hypothetical protein